MASLLLSRENQKFSSPAAKIPLPPRFLPVCPFFSVCPPLFLSFLFSLSAPLLFLFARPPFCLSAHLNPPRRNTRALPEHPRPLFSKEPPPLFCLPASTRPAKTPAPRRNTRALPKHPRREILNPSTAFPRLSLSAFSFSSLFFHPARPEKEKRRKFRRPSAPADCLIGPLRGMYFP